MIVTVCYDYRSGSTDKYGLSYEMIRIMWSMDHVKA